MKVTKLNPGEDVVREREKERDGCDCELLATQFS